MSFAQIVDGEVVSVAPQPPVAARRVDTGAWVLGLRSAGTVLQEACGWVAVVVDPEPVTTESQVAVRSQVTLVGGVPTVSWTVRELTAGEVADAEDEADRAAGRVGLRDDFAVLKSTRDDAAASRTDMDPVDGVVRWTRDVTFAGTGDTVRLEQRAAHLQVEVRRLHGDVRLMASVLVRMMRAQRLDVDDTI